MSSSKRSREEAGSSLSARERSERRWMEEQRDQIQEALLEGEERLQALLEGCMAAVYLKDLEGRYLMANRWAEIMFRTTREEVVGRTDHELRPKEVADVLRANDLKALKAEAPSRFEQRFPHEDGEYTYRVTKFPLHDRAGNLYAVCGIATDLTELKRTEEALEESEERFRSVVHNSSEIVKIVDPDGTLRYASPALERVLGYRPKELVGANVLQYVHPDDLERVLRETEKAVKEPGIGRNTVEYRFRHADGSWRHIEGVGAYLIDEPSIRGVVVNARDVTGRKEAEEALKESEERYRRLVESSPETIVVLKEGKIVFINAAGAGFAGVDGPEELVGRSYLDFVHPDYQEIVRSRVLQAQEGEPVELLEEKLLRPDGHVLDVEAVAIPTTYEGKPAVQSIIRDVTGRREAEEALKKSEERFRSLIQNASDIITLVDADCTILYQSPSLERVLGQDPEERIGENAVETDLVHPEDLAAKREAVAEAVGNPGASVTTEFRMRCRDGSWRYMEETIRSLLDDPNVGGIVFNTRDVTERKEAEARLRESEEQFRGAFEDAPIGMALVGLPSSSPSRDRRYLRVNRALCALLGYPEEELLFKTVSEVTHPKDREVSKACIDRTMEGTARKYDVEKRYVHADGHVVWGLLNVSLVRDSEGNPSHFVCQYLDVTERKRAEEALRESEERYRAVMEQSVESIFFFDPDTRKILESNTAFQRLLGYTSEELQETEIYDLLAHGRDEIDSSIRRDLLEKRRFAGERKYRCKDGSLLDVESSMIVIPYRGGEAICAVGRDVTERKALEEQLRHRAFHDPLTDLPNRDLFLDRLHQSLGRAGRLREPVAVLFVDLDDFKLVNDSLGHDAGNILLVEVGERLRACVRPGDTVARLFGDEFALLLEAPTSVEDARRVTGRIGERLSEPFDIDEEEVFVSSSVGIALSETGGERPKDILRRADLAMYAAKSRGKGGHEVFEEAMATRTAGRLRLETELRRAVEREEFEVYYQPIVELGSGRVAGLEALLRWKHPERGMVAPSEFILLAEETGLIRPLGRWVLEEACRQAREWRVRGLAEPPLVSVNLSTDQFGRQPDLISEILGETGLEPEGLQLEITERAIMDNPEFSVGKLKRLRGLGVRFAIDDYGMGYSSLHYLKRLPVDSLKIDRSFVAGLGKDAGDTAIVSGTINLAHALGLTVVAEGVETPYQRAKLRELGCDLAQGFFFAESLSREAIPKLLAASWPGSGE